MKLSVITINLNNKDGLKETIESVISQTFTDFEFIVIDGKSEDGSADIIRQYQDKITYWVSEKDSGIYNAMNKGIKQASGDYYYFLNSGDKLVSNDVFERIFDSDPHIDFICGNFITELKGDLKKEEPYKNRDWSFSLYDFYAGFLCHQAFFIHADNFAKYGLYDENLRTLSDQKLFYQAIAIDRAPVLYKDIDIVYYNLEGFSSYIGPELILSEKRLVYHQLLSKEVADKIDRMYYLERYGFVTDIMRSKKWIYNCFRIFVKLGRTFGFIKYHWSD